MLKSIAYTCVSLVSGHLLLTYVQLADVNKCMVFRLGT